MTPGGKASLKDMELVFVALAILFPVVAAFCLSLARVCFQNATRLALAKKGLNNAWKEHRRALQPYLDAQSERIALEERRKSMDDASIDETFLRQLYMHAFERGWKVPETRHAEATLYERCEILMHRTLARVDQLDR